MNPTVADHVGSFQLQNAASKENGHNQEILKKNAKKETNNSGAF
jgi:hypothetical protein